MSNYKIYKHKDKRKDYKKQRIISDYTEAISEILYDFYKEENFPYIAVSGYKTNDPFQLIFFYLSMENNENNKIILDKLNSHKYKKYIVRKLIEKKIFYKIPKISFLFEEKNLDFDK